MHRRILVAFALFLLLAPPASAGAPDELTWENLVPEFPPLGNPIGHLSMDRQIDVEVLANIRRQHAAGLISDVDDRYEEALEIEHRLKSEGVDVEALVSAYNNVYREMQRRDSVVVDELDGKLIRMPGYALPLEYTDAAVQEFLLVPFIGACIHVPPPPPNQTVFVHLKKPYKPGELYDPVWVTGRLRVKRTSTSLFLGDGSGAVDASYVLEGMRVDPYTK